MNTTTIYITKDQKCYQFGLPPIVTLKEPDWVSRTWIRKLIVEIPAGYEIAEAIDGSMQIYDKNEKPQEFGTDKNEMPFIYEYKVGCFDKCDKIPLKVLKEGWDIDE